MGDDYSDSIESLPSPWRLVRPEGRSQVHPKTPRTLSGRVRDARRHYEETDSPSLHTQSGRVRGDAHSSATGEERASLDDRPHEMLRKGSYSCSPLFLSSDDVEPLLHTRPAMVATHLPPPEDPAPSAEHARKDGAARKNATVRLTGEERARRKAERAATLAEAASRKRSWKEANRIRHRKSDTMGDIVVKVDATLVGGGGALFGVFADLKTKLEADGAQVSVNETSLSSLLQAERLGGIRFERTVRALYNEALSVWEPLAVPHVVQDPTLLLVITGEQLIDMHGSERLVERLGDACLEGTTGEESEPCRVLLAIIGLETYLRKQRQSKNRAYTQAMRRRMQDAERYDLAAPLTQLQQDDTHLQQSVEQALVQLQLRYRYHVTRIPTLPDAVDWLYSIACDVSYRPYKCVYVPAAD